MPRGGVIVNTINGDSNESFFRQLQSHFLTEINGYQILSFSVDESLIHQFGSRYLSGSYISQGFLQDLDSKNAKRFVKRFHRRFGSKQPVPEPASTGYSMVQLWAHAVETVGTTNATLVAEALIGMRFESPAGTLEISPNRHVSRTIRLGQILPNGQVIVIEDFGRIEPSDNN
jgi:urea transport system substrate-binding protein